MSVFFNGRLITTPTTASVVNDNAMQSKNLTVGNVVAYIGKAQGGKPNTLLSFGSYEEAKALLRGGELLDAIRKAFAPSRQTGAPVTVTCVRVNPAVQASLVLNDGSSAPVITVTSKNYGLLDNSTKIKVEAGTVSGKRVTVQYGNSYYTQDNIARRAFSLQYSGALASASITVSATSVVLAAPTGTTVATLLLSDYPTIGQLADKINTIADFTATVLDNNGNSPSVNGLDFVSAQDVKTAAYTVRADLQAIVDWLNNGNPLVSAARSSAVGTLPANIPYTFLAGGSDGTTTNTQWSDGFTALQAADVQWVTPISSDPAIHAMADAHVAFCSTTLRRERRAVCGMASGTSDASAVTAAYAINSDRTSLVHIGFYDYDDTGSLVLYPPYMTAALVSAMFSGVNPGTPLTNKTIAVQGLEREIRNPTDSDILIKGGVMPIEKTAQGYKIVQSISTWLVDRKYNRVEQSTGVALDFTVRNVREAVDILRGEKGNPLLLSRAVSIADSTLRELAREEPQGPGVLAGDATNPAYRNIQASLEGDVLRLQFECSPVIPDNYILVTVYAVPYSGSLAA